MRLSALFTTAALIASSLAAKASTVYTYTGPAFTDVSGPFTTSDSITGAITFASPLATNLNGSSLAPSFSFSDGVDTFNAANNLQSLFSLSTDASGNITQFEFEVQSLDGSQLAATTFDPALSFATSLAAGSESFGSNGTMGGSFGPGISTVASVTPEPSSLGLLATGMLGLAGVAKRRLR